MKKFMSEFKQFALKGNVMDLAIGVIIGAAFGKIVSSLVNDIIMPFIALITGTVNMGGLAIQLGVTKAGDPINLNIGLFLQTIIDFVIIAFVIFLLIKAMNKMKKKEAEKPAAPPEPTKDQVLLAEIRDLLKKGR